jgi:hypothetical protein
VVIRRKNTTTSPAAATTLVKKMNQALEHMGAPRTLRVERITLSQKQNYSGLMTTQGTAEELTKYKGGLQRTLQELDPAVIDLEQSTTWCRLKVHGIPLDSYMKEGGLEALAEEIDRDNYAPQEAPIRWLIREDTLREKRAQGSQTGSTIILTVHSSQVGDWLISRGVFIGGRRHRAEGYVVSSPKSLCANCGRWGHAKVKCPTPLAPACILCAGGHTTRDHTCDSPGCPAFKGQTCKHLRRKCINCGGDHTATDSLCLIKRMAMADKGTGHDEEPENGAIRRVAQRAPQITILPRPPTKQPTPGPVMATEDANMVDANPEAHLHPHESDDTDSDY